MWDAVILVLGGMLFGGGLVSLFSNLCQLVRILRHRGQINRRLAEQVERGRWTCRRCKKHYEGTLPMGPVCKHCWLALDEYLSEVA